MQFTGRAGRTGPFWCNYFPCLSPAWWKNDKNFASYGKTRRSTFCLQSQNGKYKKPQWKKTTIKHSDISDFDNIKAIRQKWQELQNKYFAENEIKNEIGETLTVDLRSYAKQNEERSKDEQLIPTKHVFRPSKNKSLDAIYQQMLDDNKKAKENNNSIRAAQVAILKLKLTFKI